VTWWLVFLDALSRGTSAGWTTDDARSDHGRFEAVEGPSPSVCGAQKQKVSVLGEWSQLERVTDELVQELLTT